MAVIGVALVVATAALSAAGSFESPSALLHALIIKVAEMIKKVDIPEINVKVDIPKIIEKVDFPEIIEKVDIPEIMNIPKIEIHPPDDDLDSIDEDYEEMYTMDQILPEKKEIIIKIDFTDDEETINDDFDDYQSDDEPDSDPEEIPRQVPIPMPSDSLSSKNTSLPSEPSSADESLEPTSKNVTTPKDDTSNRTSEISDFDSQQISCLTSNLGAIPKDTTKEKSFSKTKKLKRQVTLKKTVGDQISIKSLALPDEVSKKILDLHKQVTLKPSKARQVPIPMPTDNLSKKNTSLPSEPLSADKTIEKSFSSIKKLHKQVTLKQTDDDQISNRSSSLPNEVSKTILDPLEKPDVPQNPVLSSESKVDIKANTKDLVGIKCGTVIPCPSPIDEETESIQDPRLQQIKPHAEFNPKIDTILPSDLSDDEMSSSLEPRQEDFKQPSK